MVILTGKATHWKLSGRIENTGETGPRPDAVSPGHGHLRCARAGRLLAADSQTSTTRDEYLRSMGRKSAGFQSLQAL